MKNYTVRLYKLDDFALWNSFLSKAKNATFLFHRDFVEYHNTKFNDHSLLIFEDEKLVCLLPANKMENKLYSHQGLTYGGFVFGEKIKLPQVLAIVKSVMKFLHQNAIDTLQLKLMPSIYPHFFSEEIEYALFLTDAKLIRRDCLSVIDLTKPYFFSTDRKQAIHRGEKNNLIVKETTDFTAFWNTILIPNLKLKHSAKPVHSLEEITLLHKRFPNNIRQFNVYHNNEIVGGTTIFMADKTAHSQYISGNKDKNQLGSLDFLHNHLINVVFEKYHYFDFGTSHEENGRKINSGLLFWKECFGAKTTVQDFYEIETQKFIHLENVLI